MNFSSSKISNSQRKGKKTNWLSTQSVKQITKFPLKLQFIQKMALTPLLKLLDQEFQINLGIQTKNSVAGYPRELILMASKTPYIETRGIPNAFQLELNFPWMYCLTI